MSTLNTYCTVLFIGYVRHDSEAFSLHFFFSLPLREPSFSLSTRNCISGLRSPKVWKRRGSKRKEEGGLWFLRLASTKRESHGAPLCCIHCTYNEVVFPRKCTAKENPRVFSMCSFRGSVSFLVPQPSFLSFPPFTDLIKQLCLSFFTFPSSSFTEKPKKPTRTHTLAEREKKQAELSENLTFISHVGAGKGKISLDFQKEPTPSKSYSKLFFP